MASRATGDPPAVPTRDPHRRGPFYAAASGTAAVAGPSATSLRFQR
jgi:hypothetical protein